MTRRGGRPPKPVELKLIEGNPGKRPVKLPPKAPPEKPRCPAWLSDYAKLEWKRVVPVLDRLGLLTSVDRATLSAYCEAVATFKAAVEAVKREGILVSRRGGELVKNPALQVERDASRLIAAYSGMFGLSPSDRVRLLGTGQAGGGLSELEALLGS